MKLHRLFTLRWSAAFLGGILAIGWMCVAAGGLWLVSTAMGFCWGVGCTRMMIWDRDRLLRKLMAQQERINQQ